MRSVTRAALPAPPGGYDVSRLVRIWETPQSVAPQASPAAGMRASLMTNMPDRRGLALAASAGFHVLQADSDHLSTGETGPGQWAFAGAGPAREMADTYGLHWAYFTHFAFPPKWQRERPSTSRILCLEHNKPAAAFSPWDPKLGALFGRGLGAFRAQYAAAGRLQAPSQLLLGVHGDYGECGLLMGARTSVPGQREEWQSRFGDLHNHLGWWCADPLARAAFRGSMMAKYGSPDQIASAWKTSVRTKDDVVYPASPQQASRRHWLDFVQWYRNSVTSLADSVCRSARRVFATKPLMLLAGFADENPRGGNDNSHIAKLASRHGASVRSTHGGLRPFAENQASALGRLASACRFYGVPFWTEPPGATSPDRQVSRVFEAASQGCAGLFDWFDNIGPSREVYYRYGRYLRAEQPVVDVAMLYPTTSQLLKPDSGAPATLEKGCSAIRDVLNFDLVDERMVGDGALAKYRLLVLWEGSVYEAPTLARIRDWVRAGGVLAAYDFGKIETVEGDQSWFREVLGYAGRLRPAVVTERFATTDGSSPPVASRVTVGAPDCAPFLAGDWFETETLNGVARRWTGALAEVRLPVDAARDATVTIRSAFPPEATDRKRDVLVNGVPVGQLDKPQDTTYRFAVPAAALAGRPVATVALRCETWKPSVVSPGSNDTRSLGAWVTYVQISPAGSAGLLADPGPPNGRVDYGIDLKRLRSEWARPFGKGWTVFFPARRSQLNGFIEVVRHLTYHLSDLDPAKRDAIPIDNAWDGVYATMLPSKALYYNPTSRLVMRTIVLSPSAFSGLPGVTVPADHTHELSLEPGSITALPFEASPQELLLQCERFTDLGTLRPREGPSFSPGSGPNHVLVPSGGRVSTRFECTVPGSYRAFYRAVRRGQEVECTLELDGKVLPGRSAGPIASVGAATRFGGQVRLSRGVHTLSLRAPAQEDALADFVVLTNDRQIAGYGFGVRASGQ